MGIANDFGKGIRDQWTVISDQEPENSKHCFEFGVLSLRNQESGTEISGQETECKNPKVL